MTFKQKDTPLPSLRVVTHAETDSRSMHFQALMADASIPPQPEPHAGTMLQSAPCHSLIRRAVVNQDFTIHQLQDYISGQYPA